MGEEVETFEERPPRGRGRAAFEEREPAEVAELPPPRALSGAEFGALVERIRLSAEEVHRALGSSLHELAYQRALEVELGQNRIPFVREAKVPILYKGKLIDTRSVDFLIEGVQVEVKARVAFEPADQIQATSYLRASGYEHGVIVNFGEQLACRVLGEPIEVPAAEPAAVEEAKPKRRATRRKAESVEMP